MQLVNILVQRLSYPLLSLKSVKISVFLRCRMFTKIRPIVLYDSTIFLNYVNITLFTNTQFFLEKDVVQSC